MALSVSRGRPVLVLVLRLLLRRLWRARAQRRVPRLRALVADAIDWLASALALALSSLIVSVARPQGERRWPPLIAPAPPQARRVAQLATLTLAVLAESGRSPGSLVMRVRPVLAGSGAPVGLTRAALRVTLARVPGSITRLLSAAEVERSSQQSGVVAEMAPALAALRTEHANDPRRGDQAASALLREHGVHFWPPLVRQIALLVLSGIVMRALRDRLTGRVVRARR